MSPCRACVHKTRDKNDAGCIHCEARAAYAAMDFDPHMMSRAVESRESRADKETKKTGVGYKEVRKVRASTKRKLKLVNTYISKGMSRTKAFKKAGLARVTYHKYTKMGGDYGRY